MSEFRSLTSRRTRTYIVYDPTTKQKIYLLKDSWQVHGSLKAKIICEPQDGDILIDEDIEQILEESQKLAEDYSTSPPSIDFNWNVVSHAFTGNWQAYGRCGIIQREVCPNNILITCAGGILNDWDLSKKEDGILSSRLHEQKGLWEFMSSLLVAGHHDTHTIQDDMESFVLVVIYHALRYFSHNKTDSTLYILNNVFTHRERIRHGRYGGGEARKSLFLHNGYIGRDFKLASNPLHKWVKAAIAAVKEWIESELAKSDPEDSDEELGLMAWERAAAIPLPPLPAANEPVPVTPRVLDTHDRLARYFEICLEATNWPVDDKPYDILPDLKKEEKASQAWMRARDADRWRECQL
ncbi:hypothetical protein C0993_010201 [Termitomyces sp. T159_Od127]|nr:hypothetical protein C0993_010201 [Termitomyces sp. T159_Od127]